MIAAMEGIVSKKIRARLSEYYLQQGIHPEHFDCRYKNICKKYAYQQIMTETKMSMVGSQYGVQYPKVVVVSLDPPSGKEGKFVAPHQRTTEFVAETHEAESYAVGSKERPKKNPHWAMTQIIVKDILAVFGYSAHYGTAVMEESYEGRDIENVSAYFAHVNVAKCSMNNPGKGKAKDIVYQNCSRAYLTQELEILQPDILITQGEAPNSILGAQLINRSVAMSDLPFSKTVDFRGSQVLWLPMHHPSRRIHVIRKHWPSYQTVVRKRVNEISNRD
jgi:hypothetical protein